MDAYADPARVEGEEPRTIGPGDNSLAITNIMGPVMSRAHILNTEGNLAGGNSAAGTSIFSWDGYGAAPGAGRSIEHKMSYTHSSSVNVQEASESSRISPVTRLFSLSGTVTPVFLKAVFAIAAILS